MKKNFYIVLFFILLPYLFTTGCDESPSTVAEIETINPFILSDSYLYMIDGNPQISKLNTVKSWEGSSTTKLPFTTEHAPWILNCGFEVTSKIAHDFNIRILREFTGGFGQLVNMDTHPTRDITALVNSTGNFTIIVESSGCNWWIKIGVE